jgi:hypothetical protein
MVFESGSTFIELFQFSLCWTYAIKRLISLTMEACFWSTFSKKRVAGKKSDDSNFKTLANDRQYSGSISIPMLFRSVLRAATIVVPVPQKGSRTVSPTNENILTSRVASSNGNGAGWCLVDAPVMFQICWNHCSNSSFLILHLSETFYLYQQHGRLLSKSHNLRF